MRQSILCICIALLPVVSAFAQSEASIDGIRANLEQWVQTRQLTSRLQSDWRSEKEMLEQTAALYGKELSDLNERLAKADTSTSQVGKERADLEAEKEEIAEANVRVAEWATQCEEGIRRLAPAFPHPLASKLEPLLQRLPDDPSATRMRAVERMQNLVGILNEVDKFNGSIVVESELQTRPSGEEIQVKTLYVGLGQAYYVDTTGDFSGVGMATLSGWKWKEQAGLGPAILRAIAVYENTHPPAFVGLPMTVN